MSVHRMPPHEPFDPRQAALAHAGMASHLAARGPYAPGLEATAEISAELANAVASGLVYVGDQIGCLIQEVRRGRTGE